MDDLPEGIQHTEFTELRRNAVAQHLRKHLQGEVRFDTASRQLYSTDASIYQIEPLGVVIPRTVADVVACVQVAGEMEIPITARGGGTSLSGQSIGPGIVLDCSKYLNNIIDLDPVARVARVQPGVVLDQLNRAAAEHHLQFGPDVATASRANLGGMIGNNSAGARSIVYGKTIDHVRRLSVILSDGARAEFGPLLPKEWEQRSLGTSLESRAHGRVHDLVTRHRDEILRRFPQLLRRVSGYNLDVLARGLYGSSGLHQLIVGSEGTLAVLTEAELGLVPTPRARGLLAPRFATLAAAMNALAPCLEAEPSAVELMDHLLLELSAGNLALKDVMKHLPGRPSAVLMVEISGDDQREVADRIERLQRRLGEVSGVVGQTLALDPSVRDQLWNLRRAGMPLLYSMPGDRKPVTFVEDCAVSPEQLPEFVARFRELLQRHGTDGAFYGHASVGCLHIRPLLNLKSSDDVARMRRIASEVTDLVLEYHGSLSGEHGDGLARSEWNQKMFGPIVYQAFCEVKQAFDPRNLLNPGRVVHAPPMTDNLRYPPGYAPAQPATLFDYSKQEGLVRSVEMCNGNGACRKTQGGAMCPSYRATLDEKDSTRGRANVLRLALADEQPLRAMRSRAVQEVLDLCLMCKACKAECPSSVDMAKLKAEFTQFYYRNHHRPLGDLLVAHMPIVNRLAAPFAPVVNFLQSRGVVRWALEKLAGIDHRRSLPPLHAWHFRRWFRWHRRPPARASGVGQGGRVLLLDDCFTTYNEPEIGQAAVRLLEQAGCRVQLARIPCCGRTLLSKGFLDQARALVLNAAPALARRIADGTPILGLEPSCLLTLKDEWTELVPGADTKRIAEASHLAESYLAREIQEGRCDLTFVPRTQECVLHGHCHQKALVGVGGTTAALKLVPELKLNVLDAGCCGMAGSFGFESDHYELSVKIANLALLPALAKQPAATVVAPGTSCRHQIRDLTGRRALHPMEVLQAQVEAE
jgi:FAD/FMN-containing dehydrogenase/Fe-S oxidoreductase